MDDFYRTGVVVIPHDPAMARWARAASPLAQSLADDPALRREWLRCGET